jgi:LCP family protein required for cell wall assembly
MSRYEDVDGAARKQHRWGRRRGRGKAAGSRKHSLLLITGGLAITLTCVLVAGSLYLYVRYREVWDSINRIDVTKDLGKQRPPEYGNALNILLIGSDTRVGRNGKIGGADQGARSDTVMVAHISPGRRGAVVVSLPRDSVVPIYQCAPEAGFAGQQAAPGEIEQLNSTFAAGGPGCLWKTVENTTHIRINDFIALTFVGFEKIINGIGGVNVCLPQAVNDPMSGLHLSAGRHHIHGSQALAFWRTREDLGQQSDLQRIQRDQFLMAALLQGIEKSQLLKSTSKMLSVITATARAHAISMDSGMTTGELLRIAESLQGVSAKSVQFIEAPTVTYPPNPNWVEWTQPEDSRLFAAIAHNSKLPKAAKSKKAGRAAVLDSVSPALVKVEVLNGTVVSGLAGDTATKLSAKGFDVLGESDADNSGYTKSVIQYASHADLAAARTLKTQLGNVTLTKVSTVPAGTLNLILGSTFTGLKGTPGSSSSSSPGSSSSSASVAGLTQQFGGITGNTKICADGEAFAP